MLPIYIVLTPLGREQPRVFCLSKQYSSIGILQIACLDIIAVWLYCKYYRYAAKEIEKPIMTYLGLADASSQIVSLKDLTEQIFQGISLSRYRDDTGSPERIINVRNLDWLYVADNLSVEPLNVPNLDKHQLKTGDVIITIRGMPLRASVVAEQVQGSLAGQNLAVLRPQQEIINPVYLAMVMRSEWLALSLEKFYVSSTGTQLLKLAQLRNFQIPLPGLATQGKLAQLFLATERATRITLEKLETRQRQTELILSQILEEQQ